MRSVPAPAATVANGLPPGVVARVAGFDSLPITLQIGVVAVSARRFCGSGGKLGAGGSGGATEAAGGITAWGGATAA